MDVLTVSIANRMGYDRIPLQCVPYKLLDTEKEDGMIATLVVQLPLTHKGDDLVVYQDVKEYRHDFGKADGTAAFANHFAVHYADAVHALEEVKNGYHVVLVYSVCLLSKIRHLKRKQDGSDVETMIEAMKHVEEPFTLLFCHEHTDKSILERGSDALKGEDHGWFLSLRDANARLSETHKLQFYIAKVKYEISYDGTIEHCKWEKRMNGTPLES
uniref:Uncharacterized protein n=1 Tax=Globisporangium ultimum (strain ATCC 200006 / CBS 805.95 / DAOM BR144) TaxID=431595 RepID=K3WA42_GLOUD